MISGPLLVAIYGELGVGKTVFVRGAIQALGVEERIVSPSYVLLKTYQGHLGVYHFDFYRLDDNDNLDELGFADYLPGDGVAFVEWADRFPDLYSGDYLSVYMERFYDANGEGRQIRFKPGGICSSTLVDSLAGSITWHLDGRIKIS